MESQGSTQGARSSCVFETPRHTELSPKAVDHTQLAQFAQPNFQSFGDDKPVNAPLDLRNTFCMGMMDLFKRLDVNEDYGRVTEAGPQPDPGAPILVDAASAHVTAKYTYARLRGKQGKSELNMSWKVDFNTPMPIALLAKHTLFVVPHPDFKTADTALMWLVCLVWHWYGRADVLPGKTTRDEWTVTLQKGHDKWYDRNMVPIEKRKEPPMLTWASPSEPVHEHVDMMRASIH